MRYGSSYTLLEEISTKMYVLADRCYVQDLQDDLTKLNCIIKDFEEFKETTSLSDEGIDDDEQSY